MYTNLIKNVLLINHGLGNKNHDTKHTPHILKNHIKTENVIDLNLKGDLYDNLFNINKVSKEYNKDTLFLGGDHSLSIATINAVYEPGMKVIWMDAHPDINTKKSSKTKNIHGMPLSFLTGLQVSEYNINLPFSDILYIGIRDIDDFENYIINKYNIQYISCEMDSIIIKEKIKEFSKNSKIHLSFDLDVIDANDFNSINTPVEKGFSILKTKYILDTIYNYCNINSMDIVEINFLKSLTSDIFDDYETLRVLLSKYDIFN